MAATEISRTQRVIEAARATRATIRDLEVEQLGQAVEWVLLHPGEEVDTSIEFGMRDLQIAGDGAPTIDEGAIAEFALAIGASTDSGRNFLGDAVELAYRLPTVWQRVVAGDVPAWKARRVAQSTRSLPLDAAAYVDRHLAAVLGRCSFAQIERTVEAARAEYDPAAAEERRLAAAEQRHFDIQLHQVSFDGLVHVEGDLDLADALTLNEMIAARAAQLDPDLPLDVRRAMAAGHLGGPDGSGTQREVVIYAHTRPGRTMVDVENSRTAITPGHLKEWCQQSGTKVSVRPVIDLNEELTTDTHDPTQVMREQARLRHPTCVFKNCNRPARRCDLDHITEWPLGATTTSNLAPLCRTHHRLKTHTSWDYTPTGRDGRRITVAWTDPSGRRHTA